jgi:hypothetical protein
VIDCAPIIFPLVFIFTISHTRASQIHHRLQRRRHLLLVRSMGAGWFLSAFPPKWRECLCRFTRVAGGSQMRARLRCGVRRASEPNYVIVSPPKVSVFFIFVFVTVFCILTCAATYCSGCKLLSSDELGNINEWYVDLSCARMAFSRISHELQVPSFCRRHGDIISGRSDAAGHPWRPRLVLASCAW